MMAAQFFRPLLNSVIPPPRRSPLCNGRSSATGSPLIRTAPLLMNSRTSRLLDARPSSLSADPSVGPSSARSALRDTFWDARSSAIACSVAASRPRTSPVNSAADAAFADSTEAAPWSIPVTSSARRRCAARSCGRSRFAASSDSISACSKKVNHLRKLITSPSAAFNQN